MRDFDELSFLNAVIAGQAIKNELDKKLNTKDPTNARAVFDAHYTALRNKDNALKFGLMIGGHDVGTYTFKNDPDKKEINLRINEFEAFKQWVIESGFIDILIDKLVNSPAILNTYIKKTGEIPDGASVEETVIKGGISERGALKVRFDDVRSALGGDFTPAIEALRSVKMLPEGVING